MNLERGDRLREINKHFQYEGTVSGDFHSLQLLNVPQFLFSWLVGLKTAPRGNLCLAAVNEIHDPSNDLYNGLDQGYSGGSVGLRCNA